MNSEKKKNLIIIALGGLLLLAIIIAIIFLIMFLLKPKYKVNINPNGGIVKKDIVIKKDIIEELPELEEREGYTFVAWVNEDNRVLRTGIEIKKDTDLTAIWLRKDEEFVTITYVTNTDEKIDPIKIKKRF